MTFERDNGRTAEENIVSRYTHTQAIHSRAHVTESMAEPKENSYRVEWNWEWSCHIGRRAWNALESLARPTRGNHNTAAAGRTGPFSASRCMTESASKWSRNRWPFRASAVFHCHRVPRFHCRSLANNRPWTTANDWPGPASGDLDGNKGRRKSTRSGSTKSIRLLW